MKSPLRVTPQVQIVESDGRLTRDGFNLFQGLLDAIADLQVLPQFTAVNIADITSTANTANKAAGRAVLDTTNHRSMVARGPLPADRWDVADGSASVLPA
jgi:hypothetical protein